MINQLMTILTIFTLGGNVPTIEDFRDTERIHDATERLEQVENTIAELELNDEKDRLNGYLIEQRGLVSELESLQKMEKDYKNYEYEEVARYANDMMGDLIIVRGQVNQIIKSYGFPYVVISTEIKGENEDGLAEFSFGDKYVISASFEEVEYLLEDDIVDVLGRVNGKKTFDTVLGGSVEYPSIISDHMWRTTDYDDY